MLALLLFTASFPTFVAFNLGDEDPVRHEPRRLERPEVPGADNGYVRMREAERLLAWPENETDRLTELSRGEGWDDDLARAVVEDNNEALRALRAALDAPAFQTPVFRQVDDDLPEFMRWIQLARVSAIRAQRRARSGDRRESFEDALAAIRLGQLVQGEPGGVLIHAMVGIALKRAGLDALAAAIPHMAPSAQECRAWTRELQRHYTDSAAWRLMWEAESDVMFRSSYAAKRSVDRGQSMREIADAMFLSELSPLSHWIPAAYAYKPNTHWRKYLSRVGSLRLAAGSFCVDLPRLPEPPLYAISHPLAVLTPNGVGESLLSSGIRRLHGFEMKRCASDSRIAATATLIALRGFAREHGALPTSLEEVVPDFLDAVPLDYFDGEPLRYAPDRHVLWSVGDDLRDAGGKPADSEIQDSHELVFQICCPSYDRPQDRQ